MAVVCRFVRGLVRGTARRWASVVAVPVRCGVGLFRAGSAHRSGCSRGALACGSGALALGLEAVGSHAHCSSTHPDMMVLRIEGMGCQGCVGTVQGALEAVDNVVHARVDLKDKLAYVSGSAAAEELIAAVTAKGKRAELVGRTGGNGFAEMTAAELKASLQRSGGRGLVLDIDETLSATNVAWFERLEELFGNPEDIPREELIRRYTYAQNVPFWKTPLALAWMQRQRDDPKAQDGLPLIAGAVEGVHALRQVVPIVGYATVRPDTTNANTIAWLREHGFPDVPVVAKPASVPFADGNKWKAAALHEMWPEVQGIVDDNPKVPAFAGRGYPGIIYLFGHTQSPPGLDFAVPCGSWRDVVAAAQGSRS